jgi:hypothetical protein
VPKLVGTSVDGGEYVWKRSWEAQSVRDAESSCSLNEKLVAKLINVKKNKRMMNQAK